MPLGQKGIAQFLVLALVVIGIGAGLYLVQKPTLFTPKASGLSQTSELGLISASSNPCFIPAGSGTCSSTISWNAENRPDVKIKIREVPDLTFAEGPIGSQAAPWITAAGITFDLYSGNTLVDSLFVQGSSSAPTATPTVSTLKDGLIAYWNLNETSGNVARDYTGVNNLSILNTRPTEGKFGKARNFGNPWDYLQVKPLSNASRTSMTASAWAYTVLQPSTVGQNIVFQASSWALYLGKLNLPIFAIIELNGSRLNWIYCTGKKPVSLNEWNLVTGSFDGTNMKIYVNGLLENTCPYSGIRYNYDEATYVGYQGDSKSPFIGNIDEVAIWNRALTQDEITALAGGAIPAQVPFSIEASPNPCTIPAGGSTCTSKITWYSNYPDLKIKIKETSGNFASGASGSQDAPWITASGATFEAYSGGTLVDSLFVKGQ